MKTGYLNIHIFNEFRSNETMFVTPNKILNLVWTVSL